MMTFYFWVLVVGVTGLSDGESIVCLTGGRNVTCNNDTLNHEEAHEKDIHLWCDNTEIICPIIPSLDNASDDMEFQKVKCGTKKSEVRDKKCEIYYCQIEKLFYISALLSAFPDEPGSQGWKDKLTNISAGVPGVQEWLNKDKDFRNGVTGKKEPLKKNEGFWASFRRPLDWVRGAGSFLKDLSKSDWLTNIKQYITGTKNSDSICKEEDAATTTTTTTTINYVETNKKDSSIVHIVLPCLAVVLILVIGSFFLWRKNQKRQQNLEIGHATDQQVQPGKKMGSISDNDLRNHELVYNRPSHIYQEIPATQEDPADVLQNPLYMPSRNSSQEQQSGSQGEHPSEGQYSLLQPPTQLQPPDQQ